MYDSFLIPKEKATCPVCKTISDIILEGDLVEFQTKSLECFLNYYKINEEITVHEKWNIKKIYNSYLYNVGVDVNEFYPITIEDILKEIEEYKSLNNKRE